MLGMTDFSFCNFIESVFNATTSNMGKMEKKIWDFSDFRACRPKDVEISSWRPSNHLLVRTPYFSATACNRGQSDPGETSRKFRTRQRGKEISPSQIQSCPFEKRERRGCTNTKRRMRQLGVKEGNVAKGGAVAGKWESQR